MRELSIDRNGKYFTDGEKPFFWLGDTAWLMLQKLDREEIGLYLRNRREKGYNVIQTVLVHTLPGKKAEGSLPPGMKDVTDPAYWDFVDEILSDAEQMGLYLGLLPAWGSLVKKGILDETTVERYAHFLGKRYQGRKNLIWILGGDIRGNVHPEVFAREAEILKSYDPGRLITFHPFGRTSSVRWFAGTDWLDFHLFQSGHRRYDQELLDAWDDNEAAAGFYGEDNWRYVLEGAGDKKPQLDGEPSYERIPQGLHDFKEPYWEEWDVRRYAYWSVFAGAAGHTYGNNAIMQFYDKREGSGSYGVREDWREALHHPGAGQLRYLKRLMESVDFTEGSAGDDLLKSGQRERYHRIAVFAGEEFIFCYTYCGDGFVLNLRDYAGMDMEAYWMDPRSGAFSYLETLRDVEEYRFRPPARAGSANDWVLVLRRKKE